MRVKVHTPVSAAHSAANPSVASGQSESASSLLSALIPGVGAAGLLMTNQSASLITGTGKLWVGAALAVGAAVVGWAIRPALPLGVRVLVAILAGIALVNVNDVESQLQDRSREITREMDDILNDFEDL